MEGKKPSKIPSRLQKGILAKEKFNLDQNLRKTFDNMTNHFSTSHNYSRKKLLFKSHTRYSNKIVNHFFSSALIGSDCLIE